MGDADEVCQLQRRKLYSAIVLRLTAKLANLPDHFLVQQQAELFSSAFLLVIALGCAYRTGGLTVAEGQHSAVPHTLSNTATVQATVRGSSRPRDGGLPQNDKLDESQR